MQRCPFQQKIKTKNLESTQISIRLMEYDEAGGGGSAFYKFLWKRL